MTGESRWWHTILLLLMLLARLAPLTSCTSSLPPPPPQTFPPDPPIPPNIKGRVTALKPPLSASTFLNLHSVSPSSSMPSSFSPIIETNHLFLGQVETPAYAVIPDSSSSSSSLSSSKVDTIPLTSRVAKQSDGQSKGLSPALPPHTNKVDLSQGVHIINNLSPVSSLHPPTSSKPKYSPSSHQSSPSSSSSLSFPSSASSLSTGQPSFPSSYQVNSKTTKQKSQAVVNDRKKNDKNHSSDINAETGRSLAKSKSQRVKLSEKDTKILQTLEKLFLRNAGMQRRPKLGPNSAVPDYMLDLYRAQFDLGGRSDTFHKVKGRGHIAANTVRSFVHKDTDVKACQPPLCSRIRFDISTLTTGEALTGAELRIFVGEGSNDEAPDSFNAQKVQSPEAGAVGKARSPPNGESSLARLEIHQIMKPSSSSSSLTSSSMPASTGDDAIMRLLDTKVVDAKNASWHSFDVHPAVLRWKRLGQTNNHGLEIRLAPVKTHSNKALPTGVQLSTDSHVRVRRATHLADRAWALQRPLLVTFTDDGVTPPLFSQSSSPSSSSSSSSRARSSSAQRSKTTLRRRRRSSGNKKKKDSAKEIEKKKRRKNRRRNRRKKKKKRRRKKKGNKNICQRHSLYVDFSNVGWDDWIVAPTGYSAYFCHGECTAPIPDFAKASNHAMLQARVYKVNPGAVPKVCCVPIKMSPISMLYLDENDQTVLKNYQDMSVDECGCK